MKMRRACLPPDPPDDITSVRELVLQTLARILTPRTGTRRAYLSGTTTWGGVPDGVGALPFGWRNAVIAPER
jgi:hypothetical protein